MKTDQESLSGTGPLAIYSVNDKLPRPGQWVIVETPSVRCLGYFEPSGRWRDARDGHIIENVQSWSPIPTDHGEVRGVNTLGEQARTPTRLIQSDQSSAFFRVKAPREDE